MKYTFVILNRLLALSGALLIVSCTGEDAGSSATIAASAAASGATSQPPSAPAFLDFLADPNQRGVASGLRLVELRWGRLVQVFELDASGNRQLVHSDFLVGASIASDGIDYELAENLAGQSELTILHRRGSAGFQAALLAAEAATVPVADATQAPWSFVPRNAALSLRFDDLLDPATVDATTIKLTAGTPAQLPFEMRVFADANHGSVADPDGDGVFEFYPTRVIVDLSVSELEAELAPQPLTVNSLGLPAAPGPVLPTATLRLPTVVAPPLGQLQVLANPSGGALQSSGNGSVDLSSPTVDVVRALRGGGPAALTGDASTGFLADASLPRLVVELDLDLGGAIQPDPSVEGGLLVSSASFSQSTCATRPEVGDVLRQGSSLAVVYDGGTLAGTTLSGLGLRPIAGGPPGAGLALLRTGFDPVSSLPACFVDFSPAPLLEPNRDVVPSAQVRLRFSEPMDSESVVLFESFQVTAVASNPGASDHVVGELIWSADQAQFDFAPSAPFSHRGGNAETYYVTIGGIGLPRDLAGNGLAPSQHQSDFQLFPSAPTQQAGNLVLDFASLDMIGSDGLEELRGQFVFDAQEGELHSRPVVHFQAPADRTQLVPSVMVPFTSGVQTPLSPLGSKLQSLWRYADLGLDLLDESTTNVDVEGLSWAPIGGQVISDVFAEFSIQLGHADVLPDEVVSQFTLFPSYPSSGVDVTYAQNYADAGALVHEKSRGYVLNPADLYQGASGTTLLPFPMNRGVSPGDRRYFTWRDTALRALGGAGGSGAPFDQELLVNGQPLSNKSFAAGAVPSLGLPLLMEFRCYPSGTALGLNSFDVSLAVASSARPNFRAFSTGGFNSSGVPVVKDPDFETVASGGFSPGTGQATLPAENVSYIGAVDLVTRVSRVHSIWFDTATASPTFGTPVMSAQLPEGCEVLLAFRGADALLGGTAGGPAYIGADASGLDAYGDPMLPQQSGTPSFLNGDAAWFEDLTQLSGARFVQLRITLVANAASGATPALDGLGLAWLE